MDGYGYDGYGEQQQQPQQAPGVRPMVDPHELGEVDPEKYGPAKDSTQKIRGRADVIEHLFGPVNQELLMVKTFYFFFYSAFGSLFPLMGVYFKQMGMNASQCGLLIGMRPFIEFVSAPFWGSYADRYKKGKKLLLASLGCWIVFTLPLGFIQPPATSCMQRNHTEYVLKTPEVERLLKREAIYTEEHSINKRAVRHYAEAGISPLDVSFATNYDEKEHKSWVSPLFSSIVYRVDDIQKAFFLLLLLVVIGEFFSAPAITLADSAVITLLGDDADRYGNQRMFGSLGWGLAMFFLGIALDHSTTFKDHPCGPGPRERNYTICFATFSVLMGAALVSATQINFMYEPQSENNEATINPAVQPSKEDTLQSQLGQQLGIPGLTDTSINQQSQQPVPNIGQTKMFAQTLREMPEWVNVLKQFKNLKCASFLFVAWYMGFGMGLIFTFLFWHLQDYGGSPTLFGIASVINHISEIFAYFFSFRLITQMGHVKVLCLGLLGNILRFLYISWLTDPWWVLPFEFMQGITHAAVWAACCSYIAHNTPQHLRSSAQGVLQGIHHGLGRGCGAVIGGMLVNSFGSTKTFRGYGFTCVLVLLAFIFINFYHKDVGFVSDLPQTEDPHQVAEETSHLAPHGVPSNPIPRALSSNRLHDLAAQDYGSTYQTNDGNLGIPGQGGGANPFRQNAGVGGGFNPFTDGPAVDDDGHRYNKDDLVKAFQPEGFAPIGNDYTIPSPQESAYAW